MGSNRSRSLIVATLIVLSLGVTARAWTGGFLDGLIEVWGVRYVYQGTPAVETLSAPRSAFESAGHDAANAVFRWNDVAMDANAIDHTPPAAGENRVFGEQLGPARTALALAIVHIAIFDAVNAIVGGYQSYTDLDPAPPSTSVPAAVAKAAHNTLVALFPAQRRRFDTLLAADLNRIPAGVAKENGIELGRQAAAAILARRADDGSDHPEPRIGFEFFPSNRPGKWRPDPISEVPIALGARWSRVEPLVIASASQFRTPASARVDQRGLYGRVQRGEGVGR